MELLTFFCQTAKRMILAIPPKVATSNAAQTQLAKVLFSDLWMGTSCTSTSLCENFGASATLAIAAPPLHFRYLSSSQPPILIYPLFCSYTDIAHFGPQ